MKELNAKEKLKLVLSLAEKHDITAYEIGNNTELNTAGVHRIINGEVKKPRDKTLNIILKYIESKIVGTNVPQVGEPESKYETKDALIETQTKLIQRLEKEVDELLDKINELENENEKIKVQKKADRDIRV